MTGRRRALVTRGIPWNDRDCPFLLCDCGWQMPRDDDDPGAYPGPDPDCDCLCHAGEVTAR